MTQNTISGTSMAAPQVAGLAAYILGLEGERTPNKLTTRLNGLSTKHAIPGLPSGTRNLLAFNGSPSG
jgi:subtilisin family serine protease